MMDKTPSYYLTTAGGLTLLTGAVLRVTQWDVATYLYMFGAIAFAVGQFADRCTDESVVIRRLHAQQVLGSVFLLISAFLMYAERWRADILMNTSMGPKLHALVVSFTAPNGWIVFMCIAAAFELYSSFRLEHEQNRQKQSTDNK